MQLGAHAAHQDRERQTVQVIEHGGQQQQAAYGPTKVGNDEMPWGAVHV
jgi:hypothetical protein